MDDPPPWTDGLFDALTKLSAGSRVQVLTEAGRRETYIVTLRAEDGRGRVHCITIRRFDSSKHWLCTPAGWVVPASTEAA